MTTIGLTGGIGSGKSTVSRMLAERGAAVFDADSEAKALMESDADLRRELIEAFGPDAYDDRGRLNRAYLAQQVFSSEEEVARMNALVHHRVHAAFERHALRAAAEGRELAVYEAALIFESGADRHVDAVVVVDAPEEVRIERSIARDGSTRKQVLARMRHQLPPEHLVERADYVIDNSGSVDQLESQVDALHAQLIGTATGP